MIGVQKRRMKSGKEMQKAGKRKDVDKQYVDGLAVQMLRTIVARYARM